MKLLWPFFGQLSFILFLRSNWDRRSRQFGEARTRAGVYFEHVRAKKCPDKSGCALSGRRHQVNREGWTRQRIMPIPILIPARNEEAHIGITLASLQQHEVSPIVIANGCDDSTVAVAEEFGVEVIELAEASKVRALQTGIRHLGCQALEPFITLDADSFPISRFWSRSLLGAIKDTKRPAVVSGPLWFIDGNDVISDVIHSIRLYSRVAREHRRAQSMPVGANMLVYTQRRGILSSLADMPNYWPGEDRAMRDVVTAGGGAEYQALHPCATVITEGNRSTSVVERLRYGRAVKLEKVKVSYMAEAPAGSRPYEG